MNQNWIQRYIVGHKDTILSTVTQEKLLQLVEKGTRNHPLRQTQWKVVHQMIIGSKVMTFHIKDNEQ